MKINKILAAGVAATLAVTSLSAVASAEVKTREFDMSQSIGGWNTIDVKYKSVYGTKTAKDRAYATETNRAKIDFKIGGTALLCQDVDGSGEYALFIIPDEGSGAVTTVKYTKNHGTAETDDLPTGFKKWVAIELVELADAWWSAAKVTVSGYKFDAKGTKTKVTQVADAGNQWWDSEKHIGPNQYELIVLPDDVLTYKDGTAIAPAYFDEIEDVEVSLTLHNDLVFKDDAVKQFTSSETNFNVLSLLLSKINVPISDAVVTYTLDGSDTPDKTADVDTVKDGVETYIGDYATNKALVDGQIAKVVVTPAMTDIEEALTDKIAWISDTASVKRDIPNDEKGTDVLSVNKYKQVSTMNVMNENLNAAAAKKTATDAAGYVTDPVGITCKTADGKFVTLYKVTSQSTDTATIPQTGVEFVSVKSVSPYAGGDDVYLYTFNKALPVYTATENPTNWTGYKEVRANKVSTPVAKTDYILLNGNTYSEPTAAMQTLDAEIGIYDTDYEVTGGNTAASVIAYCIAHGGYDPAIKLDYVESVPMTVATTNSTRYAYLERTTGKSTIGRQDVKVLSYTGAHKSQNGGDLHGTDDHNQSYNITVDYNKGDYSLQFSGLASHCADFFNKQNNGTITFHFVSPTAANSSWVNGGIPSTEVGLKSALGSTAMAIFFNYAQSTGSLQCNGVVDADASTMTFDISETLNDMGGLTKGNISDIYYGMNQGLRYADYKEDKYDVGYLVDKVTLAYDDAPAAVDANTDDDAAADDDAAVVVADDDDDDADDDVIADDDDDIAEDDDIIEDDDDDDDDAGEIIEDDDDDDDDVNNDVDYVDADDDANPGTGVGLAVIPAIVAGAALVVSKKRK